MLDSHLLTFFLILARVTAFIGFLPLFARRQVPRMVKVGLAFGLTLFWYSEIPADAVAELSTPSAFLASLMIIKELTVGLLMSLLVGFIFVPARIAGAYVGQEMGLSLAAVSSPSTEDASTAVASAFEALAILLFFALDLHHFLISFMHHSLVDARMPGNFSALPLGNYAELASHTVQQGSLIVGPVVSGLFVLVIVLALLNKAAPSLNLFSVGLTLRTGLGFVALLAFFPSLMQAMSQQFEQHIAALWEQLSILT